MQRFEHVQKCPCYNCALQIKYYYYQVLAVSRQRVTSCFRTCHCSCAEPDSVSGHSLHAVIDTLSCDASGGGGSSAVALGIAVPVIIICLVLIAFFIYKIMQTRRQRAGKKAVRYSEVYKDTVETTPRAGTQQQPLSVL